MIIIISILTIICLAIAMLCRSLVHTLLHHYGSFDKKYNAEDQWWNPAISWKNKYVVKWTIDLFHWRIAKFSAPVQVTDAFHWFNTIELGAFDFIISLLGTVIICLEYGIAWWLWIAIIFLTFYLIVGILLMPFFFNTGYNKIWR